MSAAQPVADVDATNFITASKASSEAFKTATLLRSLKVNALITGEEGVGKKALARYIMPNAPVVEAKNYNELLSVLHSNQEVIILNIEHAANIKVIVEEAKKHNVRVIATAYALYGNEAVEKFFAISFTIPPLRDRMEDVEVLKKLFVNEVSEMLGEELSLDEEFEPDLSKNAISLKRQVLIRAVFSDIEEKDIMQLLFAFLYEKLGGSDDYKKYLHLYEAPLIEAGLKKFKSQLQLSKVLGLNRNTLRKKISENKEYLNE